MKIVITRLHFFLVIWSGLSLEPLKSEEEEVIDLQALLKDVFVSIQTFNTERQAMNKEFAKLKATATDIKTGIDENRKNLNEMKATIENMKSNFAATERNIRKDIASNFGENHLVMTTESADLKHIVTEYHQVMMKKLDEITNGIARDREELATDITEIKRHIVKIISNDDCTTDGIKTTTSYITTESVITNETNWRKAGDCWELYKKGERKNGVYSISPVGDVSFDVFCDMKTEGGGWTVIQRRGQFGNPLDYFYRNWTEYKKGFGDFDMEFWLGNDHISSLTKGRKYQLRIELTNKDYKTAIANYNIFHVDDEEHFYRLGVAMYSGTAGDSMEFHNGMYFSTKDVDNDILLKGNYQNCAVSNMGAWWYKDCLRSNLNGLNKNGEHAPNNQGMMWYHWAGYYTLRASEMKIRPRDTSLGY